MVTLVLTGPARFPGLGRFGVIIALVLLSVAVLLILRVSPGRASTTAEGVTVVPVTNAYAWASRSRAADA
ncbi:hypothetical protein [Nonomuraea dietziae]|uniref:hypothetical protein n=1 Tax=Nonomuraea dietziae TaxID=65515 RepID=UPI00340DD31C